MVSIDYCTNCDERKLVRDVELVMPALVTTIKQCTGCVMAESQSPDRDHEWGWRYLLAETWKHSKLKSARDYYYWHRRDSHSNMEAA